MFHSLTETWENTLRGFVNNKNRQSMVGHTNIVPKNNNIISLGLLKASMSGRIVSVKSKLTGDRINILMLSSKCKNSSNQTHQMHANTVRSLSKHNIAKKKNHFLISIFVSFSSENHLNILKTRSVYWGSKTVKDIKTWQTWWLMSWELRLENYFICWRTSAVECSIPREIHTFCAVCYCCTISCNQLHPAATSAVTLKVICSPQQTVAWLLVPTYSIRANDLETHKPTHLQYIYV